MTTDPKSSTLNLSSKSCDQAAVSVSNILQLNRNVPADTVNLGRGY